MYRGASLSSAGLEPSISDIEGHMVGFRLHISWEELAAGPTWSLGDWIEFRSLSQDVQVERLARVRGNQ